PLGHQQDAPEQGEVQRNNDQAAHPAPLLPHGAEDEVGTLLGHEVELGLGAFQEALAQPAARTEGYFALGHVPALT
nr:hypothetical protein [Tanacetum cinerariifolium]